MTNVPKIVVPRDIWHAQHVHAALVVLIVCQYIVYTVTALIGARGTNNCFFDGATQAAELHVFVETLFHCTGWGVWWEVKWGFV